MGRIVGANGKPLDNTPGRVDKDDVAFEELPPTPQARKLHKDIVNMLVVNFPGQSYLYDDFNQPTRLAWEVQVNDDPMRGTVTLVNLWISSEFGVIIPINNDHKHILKDVYKYACELFERYNITREKAFDMREDLLGIPRDFRGAAIHQ